MSDHSGIIFDYAFVFEKPVFTLECEFDELGVEAVDLPWTPWELTVLDELGECIARDQIAALPDKVRTLADSPQRIDAIRQLRDKYVYNFGHAGSVAAQQIAALAERARTNEARG